MGKFDKYFELNFRETKKKVKDSVQFDNFAIQAISNIDETNKAANLLVKRLREWYELYNPEYSRSVADNMRFVKAVVSGNAPKSADSMGADLKEIDMAPILQLAKDINTLYELKMKQEAYLEELMKKNCPNITAVAGALIGARLIALSGDIKRLVEFPSSTVQLLGAEKALFRHIKTGAKAPKHGVIHEHPLIAHVSKENKGKAARALADKISLAAKVDYFKGEFIGDKLRQEVEKRFK